jgi:hypothetical protein
MIVVTVIAMRSGGELHFILEFASNVGIGQHPLESNAIRVSASHTSVQLDSSLKVSSFRPSPFSMFSSKKLTHFISDEFSHKVLKLTLGGRVDRE